MYLLHLYITYILCTSDYAFIIFHINIILHIYITYQISQYIKKDLIMEHILLNK